MVGCCVSVTCVDCIKDMQSESLTKNMKTDSVAFLILSDY